MFSLSALLSGCVCATVLVCLGPHVRVCSAAPVQRDSRFVLPTSPSEATWVSVPARFEAAPQAAAAGAGSFVRASGSQFVVNNKPAFVAGSNTIFLALRREHRLRSRAGQRERPLCCGKLQHVRWVLSQWRGAQGICHRRASPGVLSGQLDL